MREYRVTGMPAGRDTLRTSATYPTRQQVEEIQDVRGGVIESREVTPWEPDTPDR
jgi:hypothetical protein